MTRRLLMTAVAVLLCVAATAQPSKTSKTSDCYNTPRRNGIEAYNKGNYAEAKKYFTAAKSCPTRPNHIDLDKWLKKCDDRAKGRPAAQPPAKPLQPTASTKPAKTHTYIIETEQGCLDRRMGIRVGVTFTAENMRGHFVRTYCTLSSPAGGAVTDAYAGTTFDVDGKPGMAGNVILVEENNETLYDEFFIPFGAMRSDDYTALQDIKIHVETKMIERRVNDDGEVSQAYAAAVKSSEERNSNAIRNVGETTETYGIRPTTLFVDNDGTDKTLRFGHEEGEHHFMVSTCDNVIWRDVPSWITAEQASVFVDENESDQARRATLRLCSTDGGNEVKVHVEQAAGAGRPRAGAVINSVRMEHNFVSSEGAKQLKFHVDLDVNYHTGQEVKVYALFYNDDGQTKLLDEEGNWIVCKGYGTAAYERTHWADFNFVINNGRLVNAANAQKRSAKVYIAATFDGGQTWDAQSGPYSITW